jgi:hypothetical protein
LQKQIEYWKDKYIELLEKYNKLIEERRGKWVLIMDWKFC